jgi:DNA modification methylase
MSKPIELNLEHSEDSGTKQPVTCLGMTFENDEARRAHFTEELRIKLQDPEFRKIEGFPIGSDEDILNLSDPPYYTACPNPWIADFIAEWESAKCKVQNIPLHPAPYHREPFAADVSEGKNDPIYNAHSYHTKVPHKAIMRYILHYTEPGDIVFDGFCGTGMTGVAAKMCGDRKEVMSLGYQVKPDGTILQEEVDENGKKVWRPFSKLGVRKAVLNDLSPAATFIAYNYNTPVDVAAFEKEAKRILKEVEKECGWMYETFHTDGKTKGKINYTVWSDVFVCSECAGEIVFWETAVDHVNGTVNDEFRCPHCNANLTKRSMERAWISSYDPLIQETIKQAKWVPVEINYRANNKTFKKKPDSNDLSVIQKIESKQFNHWLPTDRILPGDKTGEPIRIGITHAHHFYTKRNAIALATLFGLISRSGSAHWFWVNAALRYLSRMSKLGTAYYFHGGGGAVNAGILGTLFIPSFSVENNVIGTLKTRLPKLSRVFSSLPEDVSLISCQSTTQSMLADNSIDYLFIDPPFGANLNYSELSGIWESWLKVKTNNQSEAIENKTQGKGSTEYRQLMTACFDEAYRVLRPGRWMTVEFSNTKASVWNSIQTALTEAGFIVANVSALDKKQGSFNAVTNTTSVKQDLVISAYKPNGGFEERFQKEAQTEEGVWDFVRTHLKYLPVTKTLSPQSSVLITIPERDPRILFDQMVAYYVRKGYPVPISSQEFQIGLSQRFIERDGMFFLPDQVAEYDRKKMFSGDIKQMAMFVSDEASAIQWLRQLIKDKPQTFADINPQFMQQLGGWSKNEAQLDLRELLHQNFLSYDGKGPVPEQIHAYLSSNWKELRNLPKDDPTLVAKARDRWYVPDPNKAGDLEKLRDKALLKEFEEYKEAKKKLKVFRLEAVRTGFKKAWQERDYAVIVAVADKIPNNVLEEDPKLLMWYDQAVTRMGGE